MVKKMVRDALGYAVPQTLNDDDTYTVMANGDTTNVDFGKHRLLRDALGDPLPYQYFDVEQGKFVAGNLGGGVDEQILNTINTLNEIGVNAKSHGLKPNDTTFDNKEVLQSLLSSPTITTINIPSGVYNTTRLSASIKNKVIKGVPGKTILITDGPELLFMQDSENVVFEDIMFSALSDSEENGAVTANGSSLKNITFKRCKFSTVGSNGVKIVNEGEKTSDFITFDSCDFEDIGRMAVEFQNHNDDVIAVRYSNITFLNCTFKNIGTRGHDGMGVSMSGIGEIVNIEGCYFHDCYDIGVELIGANYVNIDKNTFIGDVKNYKPIGITNFRRNKHIIITNNKSLGNLGQIEVYNGEDILISNNTFYGITNLYIRNVDNSKVNNNIIQSRNTYCIFLDNSSNNDIVNNSLNNKGVNNYSVIRFYGANSKGNKAYDNRLYKGNGGNYIGNTDGATANFIGENIQDGNKFVGTDFYGNYETLLKNVWSNEGVSSISIELTQGASWIPFNFDVTCIGTRNGGGEFFATKVNVNGQVHGSIDLETTQILTSTKATITVKKEGKLVTLTCTHTNKTDAMEHRWLINGFCYNPMKLI